MSMAARQHRCGAAAAAWFMMSFAPAVAAPEWRTVEIGGHRYVDAGDVAGYYGFDYLKSGTSLRFTTPKHEMRIGSGTPTLFINDVLFHLERPVMARDGDYLFSLIDVEKLIDPVLRPERLGRRRALNTVVIDPGHGGVDTGTKSIYGGAEKEFVLRLAKLLKRELERKGYRVRMTRSGDTFPTLAERVVFANRIPDAVFVSLHFNHHRSRSASGIETFALVPKGDGGDGLSLVGNARDAENIALATAVHATLLKKTGARDRGIKRDRWAVLKGIDMPGVLVEGGFLSNPGEARKIASTSYLSLMAAGIADAVVLYQNSMRP